MTGFLKNKKLLDENHKLEDLLDSNEIEESLSAIIYKMKNRSILGLIGKFGAGKSTSLFHLSNKSNPKDEIWVEFDAWKYPDRKHLWEGLILDFADQIGQKKSKVSKRIDEGSTKSKYIDIVTDIISSIKPFGIDVIDKVFKEVFDKSPAKRIYQLQEIFVGLIESQNNRNIIIVIEDVDRSGEEGIFFLETLNNFLQNIQIKTGLKVIAPISDHSYYNNLDSYLKCLDYIEFFEPERNSFDNFFESVINDSAINSIELPNGQKNHALSQLSSFFEQLLLSNSKLSIRSLKAILRKSNINYINQKELGYEPDFRISIAIEAMKYVDSVNNGKSFFEEAKTLGKVNGSNSFTAFFASIINNYNSIYITNNKGEKELIRSTYFKLIKRNPATNVKQFPSIPYKSENWFENTIEYCICDFYFNY